MVKTNEGGIVKATLRVLPMTVVTVVAGVVTVAPVPGKADSSWTVTPLGDIVPGGNPEPVTLIVCTPG